MVFIAQLVEHYSANAEAMGSNLVEVTVIRIWSSRAFTNTLNLFSSCTSTPKHFSLTIISWEKAIRIKERLLDVQSDHQESFSARMKSSMIGSLPAAIWKKTQPTGIFTLGGAGRVWFLLLVSAKWLRSHDHYQGFIQWDAKFQQAY